MTRMGAVAATAAVAVGAALLAGRLSLGPTAARAEDQGGAPPVTAGKAEARDVPVYARGIGSVQAYNSVTVKTRVDGQIMQVLFTEGQDVKAGDRLFQIDPRPFQAALDQASATKMRDEAALKSAQLDLDRYSALVGKGFQTRQSYDEQKALVAQDEAALAIDQAMIDSAKLNLTYADVRSPIEGRTGARLVDIGNLVQAAAGTALVTINQLKPIYVSFTLPQDQLDPIRQGQAKAPLAADAYTQDEKARLAEGRLTLVDNQVDPATGTIHLKASFENQDERLWPGAFVSVRLVLSVRKGAITVPTQTVMQGASGAYVYVINPDSTVTRRDVAVAAVQDGIAVIDKGLNAGDPVVVSGQYRLTNGTRVTVTGAPTPAG